MTSIVRQSEESPFDAIRRIDENGSEFWWGRELMPVLGYQKWQKFSDVIQIAKENIETLTQSVIEHFLPVEIKNVDADGNRLRGRTGLDYKLSRLACYHIALCCDSRGNDQVKSAKHYFAIKTREAETIIPAMSERLQLALLENENLKLRVQLSENERYLQAGGEFIFKNYGPGALALIKGRPDAVVEKVEKVTETVICRDGRTVSFEGKSTAELAREYGFKSGAQFEAWLSRQGHGHLVCQGFRAVQAPYVPTEDIDKIRRLWSSRQGRQLMIGE